MDENPVIPLVFIAAAADEACCVAARCVAAADAVPLGGAVLIALDGVGLDLGLFALGDVLLLSLELLALLLERLPSTLYLNG